MADVISKYMVGVDGKTAYERLYGRPVREEGLEFGETLHWRHRPTKDMNVVLDTRWSSGVWLGRKWGGVVHQVYANGKVHEIRGVQRQPRELRWQRASLEVLASTPWCREPAAPGELRVLPPLAPPAAGAGREVPEVADAPEYNPHRVFIKLADLERHGFTAGCRRCILMREGRRAQGIKHQDACRDRVEQALRDAGDPRLDRAEARVMEELGRRAAGVEALPPPAGVEVPPRGVELPPRGVEGPLPRVDLPPGGVDVPPRGVERPSAGGVEGPLPRVDLPPGDAEPDEPEHPAEEARAARPSRDPGAPTQAMRDAHASTHLPFRSWCDECVQGRRDAPPHCRQKRSAGEVPEVAFDYAFIRRDDEEALVTCLVMRDRDSKAVRAWVLERKGVDMDECVDRAVAGVRDLGYSGRVLIRCDGEPALTALRDAISAALPDGATPVKTPVAESSSNGGIEGAVKIFKGLLRVHLAALERRIEGRFPSNHPVLTWLVEHVADVVSKYMVGVDGKTAFERLYGRPVREEGLEFGETLHWRHRPTKDMNVVLDTRWSTGVWLGRKWGGVVHQIFANGSVHEVRGVQRQPRDLRWQKANLEVIASTPWCREPAAPGELRVLPPLAPPAAGAGAEVGEPEVHVPEYNPHRVFIRLDDLERHGFTAGCRRCVLMREGRRAHGVKHRDECRDRVEQAL